MLIPSLDYTGRARWQAKFILVPRKLAVETLSRYRESDRRAYLGNLVQLQAVAGDYSKAQETVETLRRSVPNGEFAGPSDPSIADAKVPLRVEWRNDSVLHVPVSR